MNIEQIANIFYGGDLEQIRQLKCPHCGANLYFSLYRQKHDLSALPGRRYKSGLTISCYGCNRRLIHLDGYCPAWLEEEQVENWDDFSETLYEL